MTQEYAFGGGQAKKALVLLGCKTTDADSRYRADAAVKFYKEESPDLLLLVGSTFEEIGGMRVLLEKVAQQNDVYIGPKISQIETGSEEFQNAIDETLGYLTHEGVAEAVLVAPLEESNLAGKYLQNKSRPIDDGSIMKVSVIVPIPYQTGDL